MQFLDRGARRSRCGRRSSASRTGWASARVARGRVPLADADPAGRHRDLGGVQRARRDRVRDLPGAEGVAARSRSTRCGTSSERKAAARGRLRKVDQTRPAMRATPMTAKRPAAISARGTPRESAGLVAHEGRDGGHGPERGRGADEHRDGRGVARGERAGRELRQVAPFRDEDDPEDGPRRRPRSRCHLRLVAEARRRPRGGPTSRWPRSERRRPRRRERVAPGAASGAGRRRRRRGSAPRAPAAAPMKTGIALWRVASTSAARAVLSGSSATKTMP